LVAPDRVDATRDKVAQLEEGIRHVNRTIQEGATIAKWLRRPESDWRQLESDHRDRFPESIWELIETEVKYEGYLRRQLDQIERTAKQEHKAIPDWIDYGAVRGLKREAQVQVRPHPPPDPRSGRSDQWHHAGGSVIAGGVDRARGQSCHG
jgi:tRNA uridine 5-carboxymethylaminomethyl modification enzyme